MLQGPGLRTLLITSFVIAPGAGAAIASFGGFERTYHYWPTWVMAVLIGFAFVFVTILAFAAVRTGAAGRKGQDDMLWAPIVAGIALAAYGFGSWRMSSAALMIFPPACLLSYFIVTKASGPVKARRRIWMGVGGLVATVAFLAPALLLVQDLYSRTIYMYSLVPEVATAAFLSLLHICTIVALVIGSWTGSVGATTKPTSVPQI